VSEKVGSLHVEVSTGTSQLKKGMTDAEREVRKAERAFNAVSKKIQGSIDSLKATRPKEQMQMLEVAVQKMRRAGKLTGPEVERLGARIRKLADAGATVPPVFKRLIQRQDALRKSSQGAQQGLSKTALVSQQLGVQGQMLATRLGPVGGILAGLGPAGIAGAAGIAAVAAAGGAVIGTLVSLTRAAMAYGSQITDVADQTGMSIEATQKWGYAFGLAGVEIQQASDSVARIMQRMKTGPQKFEELGLSVEHLKSLEPGELLSVIARRLKDLPPGAERTAAAMELMGETGAKMLPALMGDLEGAAERSERLGFVMDTETARKMDAAADAADTLQKTVAGLGRNIGVALVEATNLTTTLDSMATVVGRVSTSTKELSDDQRNLVAALNPTLRKVNEVVAGLVTIDAYAQRLGLATIVAPTVRGGNVTPESFVKEWAGRGAGTGEAARPSYRELAALEDEEKKLREQIKEWERLEKQAGATRKKNYDDWGRQTHDLFEQQAEFYGQLATNQQIVSDESAKTADDWEADLDRMLDTDLLDDYAENGIGKIIRAWERENEEIERANAKARAHKMAIADGFGKAADILGGVSDLLGGMESQLGRVADGMAEVASAAESVMAGVAKGGLWGGIAAGAGALGGVVGAVGNVFRDTEWEEVNDLRDAFFAAEGGFEAFSRKMSKASGEDWAKKIFDARTVEDFNALVADAQGLFDLQGQVQEDLQAAAEKYGFTIDEMGPSFRQQEMDKQAAQLIKEWELLKNAGTDHNAMLKRMGPGMSEYVQQAIRAGVAIPENLRPAIEQMMEMGTLTDAAGNALTDLDDVTFTQSLSEGLSRAVAGVERLVAVMERLFGIEKAAGDAARDIAIPRPSGPPAGGYQGSGQYRAMATGGPVTRPTMTLLGEAGPEWVFNAAQMGKLAQFEAMAAAAITSVGRIAAQASATRGAGLDLASSTMSGQRLGAAIGGAAPGTPIEITVVSELDGEVATRAVVRKIVGGGPESERLRKWQETGVR
jgi:hypothetical protein